MSQPRLSDAGAVVRRPKGPPVVTITFENDAEARLAYDAIERVLGSLGQIGLLSMSCGVPLPELSEAEIDWAMQRRMANWTWTRIAKSLPVTYQAVQNAIWMRLFKQRQLTERRVKDLWHYTGRGRPPAWNFLVRVTGVRPSSDGGTKVAARARYLATAGLPDNPGSSVGTPIPSFDKNIHLGGKGEESPSVDSLRSSVDHAED